MPTKDAKPTKLCLKQSTMDTGVFMQQESYPARPLDVLSLWTVLDLGVPTMLAHMTTRTMRMSAAVCTV